MLEDMNYLGFSSSSHSYTCYEAFFEDPCNKLLRLYWKLFLRCLAPRIAALRLYEFIWKTLATNSKRDEITTFTTLLETFYDDAWFPNFNFTTFTSLFEQLCNEMHNGWDYDFQTSWHPQFLTSRLPDFPTSKLPDM